MVGAALLVGAAAAGAPSKQPHIAFMLVDDLGFNDVRPPPRLPPTNDPAPPQAWAVNTSDVAGAWPHVGALANESVRIATYYTTMLCTPTRGAFMTGRLPQRLGLRLSALP